MCICKRKNERNSPNREKKEKGRRDRSARQRLTGVEETAERRERGGVVWCQGGGGSRIVISRGGNYGPNKTNNNTDNGARGFGDQCDFDGGQHEVDAAPGRGSSLLGKSLPWNLRGPL